MTLNQLIRRIKKIVLEHKQIRTFHRGYVAKIFDDKKTKYPAVILQDNGGAVSLGSRNARFSFRLIVVDLVHVAKDTDLNELDVQSDMISIVLDLFAQFNRPEFSDWRISADNSLSTVYQSDEARSGDMYAGCAVDFSVSIKYEQNTCQVPTSITDYSTV